MKMSKKLLITALALAGTTLVSACGSQPDPEPVEPKETAPAVTEFRVPVSSKTLFVGETFSLNIEALPHTWLERKLTYTSDKPEVASVDENGLVTANAKGNAKITVSEGNNLVTASVDITVFRDNATSGQITSAMNELVNLQKNLSVENMEYIACDENWDTTITKNGKLKYASYDNQHFTLSVKNAYFRLDASSKEMLTEGGSREAMNYGYIFYVSEYYNLKVYRINGNTKNYIDVSVSDYEKQGVSRIEVLYLLMDNFFASGRDIMLGQLEYFLSSDLIEEATSKYASKVGTNGGATLAFDYGSSYTTTADYEDEQYRDIPMYSEYEMSIKLRTDWGNNGWCKDRGAVQKADYEIGEDKYVRTDNIDYKFMVENVQPYYPDDKEFTRVATLFDL